MPELRRDPVVGRWVIISTERGNKPSDFNAAAPQKKGGFCPFCPGNEDKTPPEIFAVRPPNNEKNKPGWRIRVVSNKFPALQIEGELNKRARGIYDIMNGIGAHEVFIETPEHDKTISTLSNDNIQELVWTYRERMLDLEKDKRFQYLLVFRNAGEAAGASLEHPHSQLIATPTVPKRIFEELEGIKKYFDFKERCVFCDMAAEEIAFSERIIIENTEFVVFTPFASRFPFEMWILPKEHQTYFEKISNSQLQSFALTLKNTIRRLDNLLNFPPYNYIIHTAPCNYTKEVYYHWHLEIIPRLTKVAGFEWGSGFYINPTPPELAAKLLREGNSK